MFGFTSKYCILYELAGCLSFSRTLQNLSLLLYLWIKNPSFSAMLASPVPSTHGRAQLPAHQYRAHGGETAMLSPHRRLCNTPSKACCGRAWAYSISVKP
ncbi:hypothetical protein NW765_010657 [Fusarium oxysporum]|nr:hypothetical protein NW765_010657 [Fusarium oxysporum]KAJ4273326.1 hypothetical protein NW764_012574 [Fusarium oxysporum]